MKRIIKPLANLNYLYKNKKNLTLVLLIFVLLTMVFNFQHASAFVGGSFTVVSGGNYKQSPDVSWNDWIDKSLVVWRERGTSSSDWNIKGKIIDETGSTLAGPFSIDTNTYNVGNPQVAAALYGDYWIVVWEFVASSFTGETDIKICLIDDTPSIGWCAIGGGIEFWNEDIQPDVGVDEQSGRFLIVWGQEASGGSARAVGVLADGSGLITSSAFPILGTDIRAPSVSKRGWGGFFVAAEKKLSDTNIGITGTYVTNTGSVGSEFNIYSSKKNHTVDVASHGGTPNANLIVWHHEYGPNDWDVRYAIVDTTHVIRSGAIANSGSMLEYNPAAVYSGQASDYVVTYAKVSNAGATPWDDDWNIYAKQIDFNGNQQAEEIVTNTSSIEGSPSIDGEYGDLQIVWDVDNGVGNSIFGRLYSMTSPCYTLTRNHVGSGSDPTASPTNSTGCPTGQYHAGQSITMTEHSASGYELEYWTGTDSSSSSHLTMPGSNHTVTAYYEATCYSLGRNYSGPGSAPTASPTYSTGCPTGQYHAGQSITMTEHSASGYHLDYWTTMPAGSHTVTAYYTIDIEPCYTLSRSHSGPGSDPTASPTYSTGCPTGQYHAGQSITMTEHSASGYHLDYWTLPYYASRKSYCDCVLHH